MDIDKLQRQSIDLASYDLSITFNGQNAATQSADGSQGKTVTWQLPPLAKKETMNRVERIAYLWLVLVCIALVVSLILAAFRGSLVSTWLFINTMQLVAHIPMIAGKLPANAHYFFLSFMSLTSLSFEPVNSLLDDIESKAVDSGLV